MGVAELKLLDGGSTRECDILDCKNKMDADVNTAMEHRQSLLRGDNILNTHKTWELAIRSL